MANLLNDVSRWGSYQTDPLRNFRFQVDFLNPSSGNTYFNPATISGSTGFSGGFTSVSGLSINTQPIQYREGGYNTTMHNIPGMTSFQPIVLSRGVVYGQDQAITWMRALFAASSGDGVEIGAGKNDYRLDLNIWVNDHPSTTSAPVAGTTGSNTPRMLFRVHNAWITSLNYSDLSGNDNNILFEGISLVHEGLSVEFVNSDGTPYTGSTGIAPGSYVS